MNFKKYLLGTIAGFGMLAATQEANAQNYQAVFNIHKQDGVLGAGVDMTPVIYNSQTKGTASETVFYAGVGLLKPTSPVSVALNILGGTGISHEKGAKPYFFHGIATAFKTNLKQDSKAAFLNNLVGIVSASPAGMTGVATYSVPLGKGFGKKKNNFTSVGARISHAKPW